MDDLLLATCGPDPVPFADAVAAVRGYAVAQRWLFARTPSRPAGHWVRVPAYRFRVFDAQPADDDDESLALSVGAAEGLHGVARDPDVRFGFFREADNLRPLIARAETDAAGRPFWELPPRRATEGSVVAALEAARALSQPDHGSAVLHHRRPRLFPLLSRTTARLIGTLASAHEATVWALIHEDLARNATAFELLETAAVAATGQSMTRLRLHDMLTWLVVTRRWADAIREGHWSDQAGPAHVRPAAHGDRSTVGSGHDSPDSD
ncbi:DUF6308 family protein [Klenkia marina]|uniref:DUF6308 family protein n=1 Tax=Klenkia marina TaxID=1960309 RepID=UPI001059A7AC|nr:DUF6308 family protein [Klenkia marina]